MRPTISTKKLTFSPEGFPIEAEIKTPVIPSQGEAVAALAGGFYGDPNRPETASPYLKRYLPRDKPEYTHGEVARAQFALENDVVSATAALISGRSFEEDPNFDKMEFFFDNVTDQTPELFPYTERILNARNEIEGNQILADIKDELKKQEIAFNSGIKD